MTTKNILGLFVAVGICELAGIVGSVFTIAAIPSWYATIAKPLLNPPAWVFGPVWTILYLLMGIAAWLVWKKHKEEAQGTNRALGIFGVQLLLNTLWSVLFFGLQSPALAFIDIVLLWLAIVWTMIAFSRISPLATYLLAPYLAWVTFASYLNYVIWILN